MNVWMWVALDGCQHTKEVTVGRWMKDWAFFLQEVHLGTPLYVNGPLVHGKERLREPSHKTFKCIITCTSRPTLLQNGVIEFMHFPFDTGAHCSMTSLNNYRLDLT